MQASYPQTKLVRVESSEKPLSRSCRQATLPPCSLYMGNLFTHLPWHDLTHYPDFGKCAGFEWCPLLIRFDRRNTTTGSSPAPGDNISDSLGSVISDRLFFTTGRISSPPGGSSEPDRGSWISSFRVTHFAGPPISGRTSYKFWSVLDLTTT